MNYVHIQQEQQQQQQKQQGQQEAGARDTLSLHSHQVLAGVHSSSASLRAHYRMGMGRRWQ